MQLNFFFIYVLGNLLACQINYLLIKRSQITFIQIVKILLSNLSPFSFYLKSQKRVDLYLLPACTPYDAKKAINLSRPRVNSPLAITCVLLGQTLMICVRGPLESVINMFRSRTLPWRYRVSRNLTLRRLTRATEFFLYLCIGKPFSLPDKLPPNKKITNNFYTNSQNSAF